MENPSRKVQTEIRFQARFQLRNLQKFTFTGSGFRIKMRQRLLLRSRPLNKMFHPLWNIRRSKRSSGDWKVRRLPQKGPVLIMQLNFQCTKMTKMHREEHLHCCQCAPQELDENHASGGMKISLASCNPKTKHLVLTHGP